VRRVCGRVDENGQPEISQDSMPSIIDENIGLVMKNSQLSRVSMRKASSHLHPGGLREQYPASGDTLDLGRLQKSLGGMNDL
jgi:hypothetical protein